MLVATFGPSTAWAGKTITWDGSQFVLEGFGRVPAAALVDYDQHGHLQWASAELRTWTWAYAHWEASGAPPAQTAAQPYAAAQPYGAAQPGAIGPAGGKKPFPAWAIVLIVAAVLLPIGGIFAAILIPAVLVSSQNTKAEESAVKEGIYSLQVGIQSWAVDHGDVYPSASDVNQMTMLHFIGYWPTNPYTGDPMVQGTGPGDYFYEVAPDGTSFTLIGYGEDGKIVIRAGSMGPSI